MKIKQYRSKIGHPQHGFGFIQDPGTHGENGFYRPFFRHPASLFGTSRLPESSNNLPYAPPVWNQDETSSCVGHGKAGMITTTLAAHGKALPTPVSPRITYALARAVDRSDFSVPLIDAGAMPNSAVRAVSHWGVVLERETDGGRQAGSPDYASHLKAHINDEPKLGELESAGKRLIVGFNAISNGDYDKIQKFRQSLATGHAIGTAVEAGCAAFQDYDERTGPIGCTGSDPDHWIFCVDYSTVAALQAAGRYPTTWPSLPATDILFLFQNSWGVGMWTVTGRFWATSEFVVHGCFNSIVAELGV